jgi:hypothetical protein
MPVQITRHTPPGPVPGPPRHDNPDIKVGAQRPGCLSSAERRRTADGQLSSGPLASAVSGPGPSWSTTRDSSAAVDQAPRGKPSEFSQPRTGYAPVHDRLLDRRR